MNDRRLLKPLVRRPGGTEWQDISWDDAINEIAARVKKTRDETFVEKDAAGRTVNRLESLAWIGGCTATHIIYYLGLKTDLPPRGGHLEKPAPASLSPPASRVAQKLRTRANNTTAVDHKSTASHL